MQLLGGLPEAAQVGHGDEGAELKEESLGPHGTRAQRLPWGPFSAAC